MFDIASNISYRIWHTGYCVKAREDATSSVQGLCKPYIISGCVTGGLGWISGEKNITESDWALEQAAQENGGVAISGDMYVYYLGMQSSSGLASVRLMVGLGDLKVIFQP